VTFIRNDEDVAVPDKLAQARRHDVVSILPPSPRVGAGDPHGSIPT